MSVAPSSRKSCLAIGHGLILAAIAIGMFGIQVALIRMSWQTDGRRIDEPGQLNDSWTSFWQRALHLDDCGSIGFLSGTVCEDEVTILVEKHISRSSCFFPWYWTDEPHEIIQCNRRNGRIRTFRAPESVDGVVSDGSKILWSVERHDGSEAGNPFIREGRVVKVVNSDPLGLYQLAKLSDGRWTNTDDFVLLPGWIDLPSLVVHRHGAEDYLWADRSFDGEAYFRKGLPIGSKEQAEEVYAQHLDDFSKLTTHELDEIGWTRVRIESAAPSSQVASFQEEPFGSWFEGARRYAIGIEQDDSGVLGFRWWRYEANGFVESKVARSPIRWGPAVRDIMDGSGWFKVFESPDGDAFVISYNEDGRLHFLQWDDGQLRVIGQRGSPWIYAAVVKIGIFICPTVVLPMFLLGLIAWAAQRWRGITTFANGHETVTCGSCIRRGTARLIDMSFPLTMLTLSVFMHPDSIAWWNRITRSWWFIQWRLSSFDPAWNSIGKLQETSGNLIGLVTWAPFLWYLFVPAIAFYLAQLVWQARSGRTIGKWLLGLKVVRTTLRPCGLARSLLREILFVVDSLFLLSWIPGVISILATRNSQRVGDLLADTIVVRDSPSGRNNVGESLRDSPPSCHNAN